MNCRWPHGRRSSGCNPHPGGESNLGGRHTRSVGGSYRRYRVQRSKRPWIWLCCLLVLGGLASLFIVRGLRICDLRQQLATAKLDYQQAWIDRAELESQLASKDDLSAIEEAARRQLGWVLPGEERVIFIDRADESPGEGD